MSTRIPIFEDNPEGPCLVLVEHITEFDRNLLFDVATDTAGAFEGGLTTHYATAALAVAEADGDPKSWARVPGFAGVPDFGPLPRDATSAPRCFRHRHQIIQRLPFEAIVRVSQAAKPLFGLEESEGKNSELPSG